MEICLNFKSDLTFLLICRLLIGPVNLINMTDKSIWVRAQNPWKKLASNLGLVHIYILGFLMAKFETLNGANAISTLKECYRKKVGLEQTSRNIFAKLKVYN